MLKITSSRESDFRMWTLCGQLAGPWVAELKEEWMDRCREVPGLQPVLDLTDVTFIDEAGEGLLREMRDRGVKFVAKGVDTRHILENLSAREKPPLRRFLGPPRDEGCW